TTAHAAAGGWAPSANADPAGTARPLRARHSFLSSSEGLKPTAARAARPGMAVARAALPARGVGESPRLVGSVSFVAGGDLAGREREPGQHSAQLARCPAGRDQRGGHLLAPLARLGDLCKAQLAGRVIL